MSDRSVWRWAAALLILLATQVSYSISLPRTWAMQTSPGTPPEIGLLKLISFGEDAAAAYALTLYLQTFDAQAGMPVPARSLNGADVRLWIDRSLDLHPDSAYPLLLASRIYAEAAGPDDARLMLDLVHRRFLMAPDQRWPWLAHALFVARHSLHDMPLALAFARSLREHATGVSVPAWVKQAEVLLLADLNEQQSAQVLLGALIASGQVRDDNERAFLVSRLASMQRSSELDRRPEVAARSTNEGRASADNKP